MRVITVVLLTVCLGFSPIFAQEKGISMDGLSYSEEYRVTRERHFVDHELDITKIDEQMTEADKLIVEIGDLYKAIMMNADREETSHYRAWNKKRFTGMKQASAIFQTKMKALYETLVAMNLLLETASKEKLPIEIHEKIIDRSGHHVRNISIFNSYVKFGTSKRLRYDTAAPFNERFAVLLEKDAMPPVNYPKINLPTSSKVKVEKTTERRDDNTVREQSSLKATATVFYLPLNKEKVAAIVDKARVLTKTASNAREKLAASSSGESWYYSTRVLEYKCDLKTFESSVKPQILEYRVAMIELKGLVNELCSILSVSERPIGDLNIRSDYEQVKHSFIELSEWASSHCFKYTPFGKKERKFFFPRGFSDSNMFNESLVVIPKSAEEINEISETFNPGSAPTKSMITSEQAMQMVSSVAFTRNRYARARKIAPHISDLTPEAIVRIGNWLSTAHRPLWIDYCMTLPNFRGK